MWPEAWQDRIVGIFHGLLGPALEDSGDVVLLCTVEPVQLGHVEGEGSMRLRELRSSAMSWWTSRAPLDQLDG